MSDDGTVDQLVPTHLRRATGSARSNVQPTEKGLDPSQSLRRT
jgi:hypothetical protein